ncbi:MAG: hypothetical protein U0V64_05520 [Cyclobacteriaceae bacterium]
MRFSEDALAYLRGEKFSNGFTIATAVPEASVPGRLETVLGLCTGKRVVHLGCADHLDIIDQKIANRTWLHARLMEVAASCIGVDNNEEALAHLRAKGYRDLHTADITRQDALPAIIDSHWDIMLLGEIIEHIGNPVMFLEELRKRYAGSVDRIVLTTPHAFRFKNFTRSARRHVELVNSDHRFWFTPYTLAKVAMDAGLQPEEFWLVENMAPTQRAYFKRWLLKQYPAYRDTIVMVCRLG